MKMGWWWRSMGRCTAIAALTLAAAAPGASAQVDDQDCRCVDADGNAIENCTCFVVPDLDGLDIDVPDVEAMMRFGPGDFDWAARSARPRLGVTVRSDQDGTLDARGARVAGVMEEGPAYEAGIREGDIITSVDGRSLLEPLGAEAEEGFDLDESMPVQRLLAVARELEPGQEVEVRYVRDGEARTATVEVRDLAGMWSAWARDFTQEVRPRMERFRQDLEPRMERFREELRPRMEELRERLREQGPTSGDDFVLELDRDGFEPLVVHPGMARYGLRLMELTPGLGEYFGTDSGVLVTDVDEDSPLGLEAGDVILLVGDREADSAERVRRLLATYDRDESVSFRVVRRGSEVDVLGRLSG